MSIPSSIKHVAYEWLIDAAPYALIAVDQRQIITLVNRAAERLFQYEPGELLGQRLDLLIPEALRGTHQQALTTYLHSPDLRMMGNGRDLFGRRKDGTRVPVEVALNPTPTPDGPVTLASVMDISERKRREDQLRRSNQDLEHFAYVLSHDLREPLRMVSSFLDLLSQKCRDKLDHDAQRYIHFAVDGAARMQRMIHGLLAYSRVGSQQLAVTAVDCAHLLRAATLNLSQAIQENAAKIEADELPFVQGDERLLQQLFESVLDNAIKFRGEAPPHISISATRDGDQARLRVRDNGVGFDPKDHERVFEIFSRLHHIGKYEGCGMGLAIAKRIIEIHGGEIGAEAAPDAGCCIHFSLPLALSQATRA